MIRRKGSLLQVVGISMLVMASALLISQSTGAQVGKYSADLKPRTGSNATGKATLEALPDHTTISYSVTPSGLKDIKSIFISEETGTGRAPDVVTLRSVTSQGLMNATNGTAIKGNFTAKDLNGPLAGKGLADFIKAITDGKILIRVESTAFPLGEIAGKVNVGGGETNMTATNVTSNMTANTTK
jgi:hypothetical protein